MSETDDTDDLLILAPDIFTSNINILDEAPYFNIVDNLISQVHILEDRVNYIEQSDQSIPSEIGMDEMRKYSSTDDLLKVNDRYTSSTFSTPVKPRERYRLTPSSPQQKSPKQRGHFTIKQEKQKMLNDIDLYLQNNESSRTKLSFDDDCLAKDVSNANVKAINLKEIEDMLQDLDVQKRKTELRLREKERDLLRRKCGSPQSVNNKMNVSMNTESGLGDRSGSSSDSTQVTAKRNLDGRPSNALTVMTVHHDDDKLMSLRDLWCREGDKSFKEKYEEEKFRRQHCEDVIQDMQSRALELQERLAVALQVDQSKDKAILRFHEAWEQVSIRLKSLTKERDALEDEIKELQQRSVCDLAETAKKIAYYEKEASKALNLAHGNQEKLIDLERANKEQTEKLELLSKQLDDSRIRLQSEIESNLQLNQIIIQKEIEINQSKHVLQDSRKEISQSKRAVEKCQAELASMQSQCTQLELLLNDKQAIIKDLEVQKRNISADNDNLKMIQKRQEGELLNSKEQFEKGKSELRNFYQRQVEVVVKDKLKEFQAELDKAENSWLEEIKNRELGIAKTAALHIQQLSDKHELEINLIEKKHTEEMNLYQMQLSQTHQQMEHLQTKLKLLNERRATVAQQLHKVMEAQWLEALKIINSSGRSPTQDQTMDRLNSLKSKSYSNLEEVLSQRMDADDQPCSSPFNDSCGITETPINSKMRCRGGQQIENDLQKYVQLLLSKQQPVKTLGVEPLAENDCGKVEIVDENWATETAGCCEDDNHKKVTRRRCAKPPWK